MWWYGAIKPNTRANHVPRVVVWFRLLTAEGGLGEFRGCEMVLPELGQFRIGSVWQFKRSISQIKLERRRFELTYSELAWRGAQSSAECRLATGRPLISEDAYTLPYGLGDRSKVLTFHCDSDETLLVPSLEFFTRAYARDAELNRILSACEWDEVKSSLHLDAPVEPQAGWHVIDLPPRGYATDAPLLAHLRYIEFTRRRVREIRSQIQVSIGAPKSGAIAFPTIGPWFEGPAQLEVEGLWIAPHTFLGLRITGYSLPPQKVICHRSISPAVGEEGFSGLPHPPGIVRRLEEGEVMTVDDTLSPASDTEKIEIADPVVRILGAPPPVKVISLEKSFARGVRGAVPQKAEKGAPGSPSGKENGIGRVNFVSDVELESEGALRDLWTGLQFVRDEHKGTIESVTWFSFEEADTLGREPKLLRLKAPEQPASDEANTKNQLSAPAQQWLRIHPDQPNALRGMLVLKVEAGTRVGYLFEVQRKLVTSKGENDEPILREENYCGLAVRAPQGRDSQEWISEVMVEIAESEGIMRTVLPKLPWLSGADYRRTSSQTDQVAGQSTATNALRKLGIDLPRFPTKDSQSED